MPKSSISAAIEAARRVANETDSTTYIVSIESGDGSRRVIAADSDYLDSDEFDAFCGRVIDAIEPG